MIIIYSTLLIFGIHAATRNGMLLDFLPSWYIMMYGNKGVTNPKLATFIRYTMKPLFNCPPCMASIYTPLMYLIFAHNWVYLPLTMLMVCGLNHIISRLID